MITFSEAMVICTREKKPGWDSREGTFYVSPKGYEDAEWYLVQYGPAAWLRDGNRDRVPMDQPCFLVNKESGKTKEVVYLEDPDTLAAMTPVKARKE